MINILQMTQCSILWAQMLISKRQGGEGLTLFYIGANAKIIGINLQPYNHLLNPHITFGDKKNALYGL